MTETPLWNPDNPVENAFGNQQPLPKPEKKPTVVAQRTIPTVRRVSVPLEGANGRIVGKQSGTMAGPEITVLYKKGINYPNPAVAASNYVAETPEGNQLAALQQQLYLAGYLSSSSVVFAGRRDRATINALTDAMADANTRGTKFQTEVAFRIQQNALTGANYFGGGTGGSGGGGAASAGQMVVTGPKQARQILDTMYLKYTGKRPDDKTFSTFYERLTNAQYNAPIKYETKVVGGKSYTVQVTDGVDASDFAERFVSNRIDFGSDELTGVAGENLTAIEKLSEMYGVSLSGAELAKYNKRLTKGEIAENDIRKVLVQKARIKFKPLGDSIDETVSTKDLLNEHMATYARVLEIPQTDVKVSDVMKNSFKDNQLVSVYDMEENIKNNDVRYRSTKEARNNAIGFAVGLARVLGYGV